MNIYRKDASVRVASFFLFQEKIKLSDIISYNEILLLSDIYFFFPPFSLWERALAAAVLLVALVLPSLKTFEAAVAADLLVTLLAITFQFLFPIRTMQVD